MPKQQQQQRGAQLSMHVCPIHIYIINLLLDCLLDAGESAFFSAPRRKLLTVR